MGKAARARALGLQVHGEHPAQVLAGDSRGPEHPERLRNGGPDSVVSSFYPERAMLLVRAQKTAGLGAGCSRMGLTLGPGAARAAPVCQRAPQDGPTSVP